MSFFFSLFSLSFLLGDLSDRPLPFYRFRANDVLLWHSWAPVCISVSVYFPFLTIYSSKSMVTSGIGSPSWDRSFHDLAPNITGGIRERLRTGHRPGTDSLPVGQCLDPSQSSPHTHHASADFTPGSQA